MYQIVCLKQNDEYENLQTWYLVRNYIILPDKFNPEKTPVEDVDDNLDEAFCTEENCLHIYKILSRGLIHIPLFDSRELDEGW